MYVHVHCTLYRDRTSPCTEGCPRTSPRIEGCSRTSPRTERCPRTSPCSWRCTVHVYQFTCTIISNALISCTCTCTVELSADDIWSSIKLCSLSNISVDTLKAREPIYSSLTISSSYMYMKRKL